MSELEQTFYAGIPIILENEKTLIEDNQIFTDERRISPVEVGNAFVIVNPKLQRIIEDDQDAWRDLEYMDQDVVPEEHFPIYLEGITLGYCSVIRIFATVYYLRSGCSSIEELLDSNESSDKFPMITDEDVETIKDLRFGSESPDFSVGAIDLNSRENRREVDSPYPEPQIIYDKYTAVCQNFNSLINSELDCLVLDHESAEEQEEFSDGFWDGVLSAVEMFYLLAQNKLFREQFDQEFKDNFNRLFDNLTK